ncbi:hypothetical protein JVU11DRAFT_4130 [Chiua virens]|nr:hypothetical protein JVU11DRAFT_4130 [Chiua virens]
MFKRVERKRKRREEDDELGLDENMKDTLGLVDTESDESDSDDSDADADMGQDEDQEEDAASEGGGSDEEPPISVAEALKESDLPHFSRPDRSRIPTSDAWELLRTIRSVPNAQGEEPQGLSKRALKRQAKQATIREKRKRHKELKAKATAKKTLKKLLMAGETNPSPPTVNSRSSPVLQNQQGNPRKKRKVDSNTSTESGHDDGNPGGDNQTGFTR